MELFLTSQIKELDAYTIKHEPIDSINLMERAARTFTDVFCQQFQDHRRVIVFAGAGNNGGDALAIARMLHLNDYSVEIYLFNPKGEPSSDCLTNKNRLLELPQIHFTEVKSGAFVPPELEENDIVIDGLFGSGLNKPLEGGFASIVKYINASKSTVVSIDMPSGLLGEDNSTHSVDSIINADYTYTFQFPKLSFLFSENERYVGNVEVLDIGLHPKGMEEISSPYNIIQKQDVQKALKSRSRFAHKGTFGHALLIAGSLGKMGAAVLAGKACLRSGAGLLSIHVPQSGNVIVQTSLPEAMTSIDDNEYQFSKIPELNPYNAIAVGPGISTDEVTVNAVRNLLQQVDKPLVLDADALNIMTQDKSMLELVPENSILTPHPKEFDRLTEVSTSSYERLQKAMEFAVVHKIYIILKGHYTAVCTPQGTCWFNVTGNAGMATAGSGDVLTGILLGLSAQSYTPFEASLMGIYLHGLAGDIALKDGSEESLLSGDIIRCLGSAFREARL